MSIRLWFNKACAAFLIVSGAALAFIQVLDIDTVASGTLMYIAQAFTLAGSLLGIDYYLRKFANNLKSEKS